MQGVHVPIQAPQKYLDMYSHVADDVRRQYLACTTVRDQRLCYIHMAHMIWENTDTTSSNGTNKYKFFYKSPIKQWMMLSVT